MTLSPTITASASTAKSINANGEAVNAVFYTVPEGRMFTGYLIVSDYVNYRIYVNGVAWQHSDSNIADEMTFGPGTTFKSHPTGGNHYAYGIERDLA
jgi:hypothetical protein